MILSYELNLDMPRWTHYANVISFEMGTQINCYYQLYVYW